MAATLTDELTRVSVADIEKWDEADGTVYVYGRCTTPEVDTDDQVVDSGWSGPALKEYLATAPTVRVQHNPQRDPAGSAVRVDVNRDGDGAHWLKAAVDEPVAQRLVKKGHLRAFSVGIARPVIERDVSGKARGGVIKGGKIVEVSLVDSPANRSCFLEIAKSAADGTCEFTGKVFADEDVLQKALGADLTKGADDEFVNVDLPRGASISVSPADFAKLHTFKQQLVTKTAAVADKRDIGAADRRRIADAGNAVTNPDGHVSYPIENTEDLENAARLARSGHGDVAAARRLIARRAGELGVANPLDESEGASKSASNEGAASTVYAEALVGEPGAPVLKEAEPEVTKDPEPQDKPKPVKKAKKKPKKLPPWLNKPKDGDSDSDDDSSCKGAHAWIHVGGDSPVPDIQCEKCKTTPAEAAGLSGSHDMNPAPVPELLESPPMASTKSGPTPQSASDADEAAPMDPAPTGELDETPAPASAKAGMMQSSPEVAAILRFKHAGMDIELGRLHDLTCPAYHPEDVAKCHPFSDLARIDVDAFQREAVKAACGPDLGRAQSLHKAWQAAHVLKAADPAQVNDYRLAAHKAFRDANPGPSSAPTPGMISPGKYNRPLVTDGHEASSTGHDGPNSSPQVATSAPDAHSFDRPPLAAGHQSPSPSHMKANFEYPDGTGRPQQLNYAHMEKDRARMALVEMHDHLGRQFPEVCPMDKPGDRPLRGVQPEHHPVPATVGVGKGDGGPSIPADAFPGGWALPPAGTLGAPLNTVSTAPPVAAVFKAPAGDEDQFMDAEVYKGFKKMRKKLGKKVLAGKITVDEARAKMGRQFAQKGADGPQEAMQKGVTLPPEEPARLAEIVRKGVQTPEEVRAAPLPPLPVAASFGPEDIEAAVTKAVAPLLEKIQQQDETYTTKLAETQRVIDAIADQPDPSTAAFSGLAFNPVRTKAARPAGVTAQAEIAERTQNMVIRSLQDLYNSSSDPYEREGYYKTLSKMRGITEP